MTDSIFKSNLPIGFETGKRYSPVMTETQRLENIKRNKERWAAYDDEYRKAWSEASKKQSQEYWNNITEEERQEFRFRVQDWWDSKDKEYRLEHGKKSQAWREDAEKILAYADKKINIGIWRDPMVYRDLYYQTMCVERFSGKLYKKLAQEYDMPIQTVQHVAIGLKCSSFGVSLDEHKQNLSIVREHYNDMIAAKREQEDLQLKQSQNQAIINGDSKGKGKFWFQWELISPGYGAEEIYDYYNENRKANQKMPVAPSLVYYFRQNNFTPRQIRDYCQENDIYHGTDTSYWYKLKRHNFPWYSNDPANFYNFERTADAASWLSKKLSQPKITQGWLHDHGYRNGGLQTAGLAKGWVIRKVPVFHNL